ncbi:hypothetical protein HYFRA_00004769 [Hymenoscyphus fraxineus]|uniref:Uncharacterized protein n=1 Tax=Hymenoscyphus fraxineus TaxID=746836 RepID=A0A9N9PP73_9HELO|nr:hypothetical protein HYFRA_00004769 [Hymenoscyphus fraxineus]
MPQARKFHATSTNIPPERERAPTPLLPVPKVRAQLPPPAPKKQKWPTPTSTLTPTPTSIIVTRPKLAYLPFLPPSTPSFAPSHPSHAFYTIPNSSSSSSSLTYAPTHPLGKYKLAFTLFSSHIACPRPPPRTFQPTTHEPYWPASHASESQTGISIPFTITSGKELLVRTLFSLPVFGSFPHDLIPND